MSPTLARVARLSLLVVVAAFALATPTASSMPTASAATTSANLAAYGYDEGGTLSVLVARHGAPLARWVPIRFNHVSGCRTSAETRQALRTRKPVAQAVEAAFFTTRAVT
jgi:hypothetical protein